MHFFVNFDRFLLEIKFSKVNGIEKSCEFKIIVSKRCCKVRDEDRKCFDPSVMNLMKILNSFDAI